MGFLSHKNFWGEKLLQSTHHVLQKILQFFLIWLVRMNVVMQFVKEGGEEAYYICSWRIHRGKKKLRFALLKNPQEEEKT
jgi:hypothetical protein